MDPSPTTGIIFKLILLFVLLLINAFFSSSELAIITLNDNKIRKMADSGNGKAKKIITLTSDSTGFLSTIQIGVTLTQFFVSAIAADSFAPLLADTISKAAGVSLTSNWHSTIEVLTLILMTVVVSYFALVIGELVPKRIAMQRPEKVAFAFINAIMIIKKITKPFVKLLTVSANVLIRLFGLDPNASEEEVTEEEIRMLVDVGEEKGVIEESQKEMIYNIFEFDDILASEIMTHRTSITACDIEDTVSELVDEAIKEGYSRIPVFKEDLDNIVGIVYVKDFLRYVNVAPPDTLKISDIMRTVHFVPETKRCRELFTEMTKNHIHVAIVVDEYGGTAGMITMEDLIESILGNIQDEYDTETEEITQHDDDTFTIEGSAYIEEVEERLDITLPEGEFDTLGGMIYSALGRIPSEEEHAEVEIAGYRFTILSLDERRIDTVKVERLDPSELPIEEALKK